MRQRFADVLLFTVTVVELAILVPHVPTFRVVDWIYVSQHLLVLGISFARPQPKAQDYSLPASVAGIVAMAYPYAQVALLKWIGGHPTWPKAGLVLVVIGAFLSTASLLSLGRSFGIFPAWRRLVTKGPYHVVRHPMYLSYLISDVGYNLQEWNYGTILVVLIGWASLIYRIHVEERVLSHDAGWPAYAASVPYRLLPGLW